MTHKSLHIYVFEHPDEGCEPVTLDIPLWQMKNALKSDPRDPDRREARKNIYTRYNMWVKPKVHVDRDWLFSHMTDKGRIPGKGGRPKKKVNTE